MARREASCWIQCSIESTRFLWDSTTSSSRTIVEAPELCEIAVLRTEDSVLHPLAMLALEVAEAPTKQIVLIVKAVAATLSLSVLVRVQLLHPVRVAEGVQGVLAGGHARADHCNHARSRLVSDEGVP